MLIYVSTIAAWHVLTMDDHAHLCVDYHRWHVLAMDDHAHLCVDYHRLACAYHG